MQIQNDRPIVAIIGRPNVGKSSIFNRLAGKRIAIVHEDPGVTRDRIICTVRRNGKYFDLVDTGGLENAEVDYTNKNDLLNNPIEAAVRRQVNLALGEAHAVIFVVDARVGVTAADEKTAAMLHKSGLTVLLAANKADDVALEFHVHEFEKFGFRVFPVSALRNRGFDGLIEELGNILPPGKEEALPGLRVALIGRPNVGKSLLINRLSRSERLIVSDRPGTTRDSIDVPLKTGGGAQSNRLVLVDTAGLRQAKKINNAVDAVSQMHSRQSISSSDIVALVLDAGQGPTSYDKNILARIVEEHKGCVLIVNKWDLAASQSQQACRSALHRELPFADFAPVVCVSALTGFNVNQIAETINYVAEQSLKKIATGILNRAIEIAEERFQPPLVSGKRLKIFYATQINVRPITFLLFVNDPDRLAKNYEKYLENSIRKAFGFEGAPIVFKLRKRDSHEASRSRRTP